MRVMDRMSSGLGDNAIFWIGDNRVVCYKPEMAGVLKVASRPAGLQPPATPA